MSDLAILDGHKVVPCDDLKKWCKWFSFSEKDRRRVAFTRKNGVDVSTVFLGLDHGWGGKPKWFETMIFGGEHDQYQERYTTWAEAEIGHELACNKAFGDGG